MKKLFLTHYLVTLLLLFSIRELMAASGVTFSSSTNFTNVNVGSSQTITYTLTNNTSGTIRLDSYWFNYTNAYKLTLGTCKFDQFTGFKVSKGKSCTVNVTFAPTTSGTFAETLTIGYFLGSGWTWKENYLQMNGNGVTVTAPTPTPVPTTEPVPTAVPTTAPAPTAVPTTAPTTTGWLKVDGNKIVNDQQQPVILKGLNIADVEHLNTKTWERPGVTARSVANAAADQYFAEVIRIPVLPGNSSYPNEGFFSATNGGEKYFTTHLDPIVKELTAKGVYVIIDLHYVSDYQSLYPKVQEFWTFMAPKYKDNPYVIYEIFNEPILPDNWSTWKTTIAQPAVDLIRSFAPNNLILVGGPYWSSHMSGAATDPVNGTNLVYVGHVYSNQTATAWAKNYEPVIPKYPMFITEWGFETGGTEGGDINYGTAFEAWMRKYNLSWTVWSYDTQWGPRMVNTDWSLKASPAGMGTFVRDLLIEEEQLK